MRSPLNVSAGWISRRTQRTQVRMATAMLFLMASTFITIATIGIVMVVKTV